MHIKLWISKYEAILRSNKIKVPATIWFLIAAIFGIIAFIILFLLADNFVLGIVGFIAAIDIIVGLPAYIESSRISSIENQLPNALREMAYILKSGGTYEYALREVTKFDYGPLTKEFEKVLMRLEEGSNFEDAFGNMAREIDSDLVKKVVAIIVDSVKAGAGLADVLDEISEDARKIYKLEQDRKAKTTMQVLFIVAAGAFIAPAIFGLVMTIVGFLVSVSATTGLAAPELITKANVAKDTIEIALMMYIFFEGIASSFMIALMRDKSVSKAILYFPLFLLAAYGLYYLTMAATKGLLSGMI